MISEILACRWFMVSKHGCYNFRVICSLSFKYRFNLREVNGAGRVMAFYF